MLEFLKPCPFCGCSMYITKWKYPDGSEAFKVLHEYSFGDDCILENSSLPDFATAEDAIEMWNRRDED